MTHQGVVTLTIRTLECHWSVKATATLNRQPGKGLYSALFFESIPYAKRGALGAE